MTEAYTKKRAFSRGAADGAAIGIGYFAVAFSLGITAAKAGFGPLAGMTASATTYASAGEYVGFMLYGAGASLLELILVTMITNARYLLMGCALNQRIPAGTPLWKRLLLGVSITDEIFAITIARRGSVNIWYPLGAFAVALPMWTLGTGLGIRMGTLLPPSIVAALSVALYGMFLAVIIPAAKKDRVVLGIVTVSFAASFAASKLPGISALSEGTRTILLTILIAGAAAVLFPVKKTASGARPASKERRSVTTVCRMDRSAYRAEETRRQA